MPAPTKLSFYERCLKLWEPDQLYAWTRTYRHQRGWRAFGVRQLEVLLITIRSLHRDEITLRAAALTYNAILSIVPLLAVGFALFKAFGGLQKLEQPLRQFVLDNLAVGRAEEVGQWIEQFIAKISAGAIAGVGVLFLFYSAVGLLTNIESSINRVWGVERSRPLYIRFAIYWCLVTLAPPLLGFSVSFTARLQTSSFASVVVNWLPFGLGQWLLSLISALSVCVVFILTFLIVPNTKVKVKAALVGGIWTGLIWSLSKYIFIMVSASSLKYSAVYGALGVLPLLMLWIYVSWLIVLFGATYTFAWQAVSSDSHESSVIRMNQATRELLALRLTVDIALAFYAGQKPPTAELLAKKAEVGLSLVENTLVVLVAHQILLQTGKEEDLGYVPARDLQELKLIQILEVLRHQEGADIPPSEDPITIEIRDILQEVESAGKQILDQMSLRDLVLKVGYPKAAPAA